MTADLARRIETGLQRGSSAVFAGAIGFAVYAWLAGFAPISLLAAATGAAALAGYLLCSRSIEAVDGPGKILPLSVFDVRALDPFADDELVLTDTDRVEQATHAQSAAEPLVLDDILAEIAPDSRVVRLFDPSAMPTPAQLRSRIDSHLDRQSDGAQSAEAARALHEALAELRRSVR